jgi:hypothetical protein
MGQTFVQEQGKRLYDVEMGTAPVGLLPNFYGPYRRYGPSRPPLKKGPNGPQLTPEMLRKWR